METLQETITQFEEEVMEGLASYPKSLPSKYFYDEVGDALFQQIMDLPEYYLTRAEYEIFETQVKDIIDAIDPLKTGFDLIELGAGDGYKTKVLLHYLQEKGYPITYKPIDISQHALDELNDSLKNEIPELNVETHQGEYFEVLERIDRSKERKKVILFLGSNLGNLNHKLATEFLKKLEVCLNPQDTLLMGLDLKKDPETIKQAYDDARGVTAAFNLNLLDRINREMGADFKRENFIHQPHYNPETGTAKSFLVSTINQEVYFEKLDCSISFKAWESIHTEISQKYDDRMVNWLCNESGLTIETRFTDSNDWFANYLITTKRA